MPDKPCISIPVLYRYLKQKGFTVKGFDLNNLFYRHFLSKANLSRDIKYIKNRFHILNAKKKLNLNEKKEYDYLHYIIRNVLPFEKDIVSLYQTRDRNNIDQFFLFQKALSIACAPFLPEHLVFTLNTGYIRHKSPYNKFSSADIYKSIHSVCMYDNSLRTIIDQISDALNTLAVGISVTFPDQILPALKCAKIIKDKKPGIHISLGGAFISAHMRAFNETGLFEVVDSLILDDGEIPLEMLLRKLRQADSDLSDIPGITYFKESKKVVVPPQAPLDKDKMPFPDYSLFPLDNYMINKKSMALLFRLSRGCYWARCAFCRTEISYIKDYIQPEAQMTFKNLKEMVSKTGIRVFHFTDNAASPEILEQLSHKIIQDNLNINWVVNLRFSRKLTLERIGLYKKAGCRSVYLGLESLTPRILKMMNKGISVEIAETCLENFAQAGIPVTVYMIIGFPTETVEEAQQSFSKIMEFKEKEWLKNCVYNVFELTPHSPIKAAPEKFGIHAVNLNRKERDLNPPITDFSSPGMRRDEAEKLCLEFIRILQKENTLNRPYRATPGPHVVTLHPAKTLER